MKVCDFCKRYPTVKIYFSYPHFAPTIEKDVCKEHFIVAFGEDGKDFLDYFGIMKTSESPNK